MRMLVLISNHGEVCGWVKRWLEHLGYSFRWSSKDIHTSQHTAFGKLIDSIIKLKKENKSLPCLRARASNAPYTPSQCLTKEKRDANQLLSHISAILSQPPRIAAQSDPNKEVTWLIRLLMTNERVREYSIPSNMALCYYWSPSRFPLSCPFSLSNVHWKAAVLVMIMKIAAADTKLSASKLFSYFSI